MAEGENAAGAEGQEGKSENVKGTANATQGPENSGAENNSDVDLVSLIDQPEWKSILIDLVKSERMDPWDIDVAELADKYITKINAMDGTDLRLPANAILCSAILLKFKSRILKLSSIDEEDELLGGKEGEMTREEMLAFEDMLPELKSMHRMKEGKVSLDSLVESIERMLEKSRGVKKRVEFAERPEFLIPALQENIEAKMDEVYALVKGSVDKEGLVLFSQLAKGRSRPMDVIMVFLPVLFLANKGRLEIWQDEFFGEIFVSLVKEKGAEKEAKV
ncbi:MAG: ScpA family protein [Candidatus Diapherotrites archaeon]